MSVISSHVSPESETTTSCNKTASTGSLCGVAPYAVIMIHQARVSPIRTEHNASRGKAADIFLLLIEMKKQSKQKLLTIEMVRRTNN